MKRIFILILVFMFMVPDVKIYATTVSAQSACLINALTGEVVYEKNSNTKMAMASTTKIMTAIVALEKSKLDEVVTVSKNAAYQEGSSAYLAVGAKIKMIDLLYGLMLNSGNDAAVAVAEHISGSSEDFATEMNELASAIGTSTTQFKNPNGLADDEHYTTAYDLAKIARYAMKNETFREIVSSKSYRASYTMSDGKIKELEFINHNKLLNNYDGCIGIKTGYTKASGRCLVSAANRDGVEYIAVTLNAPDDWNDHKNMLDFAYSNVRTLEATKRGNTVKCLVNDDDMCNLIYKSDFNIPVNGEKGRALTVEINIPNKISPPLNKDEKVGVANIMYNDEFVGSVDIIAEKDMYFDEDYKIKNSFLSVLARTIRIMLK